MQKYAIKLYNFILETSTPGWFMITSSSSTARIMAELLGLYEIVGNAYNGHPVYKMVGGDFYLYYSDEHWIVGAKIGDSSGFIRSLSFGDEETPLEGWSFFDGSDWASDEQLMVEPYNGRKLLTKSKIPMIFN